jgi:hypothetical protein
MVNLDPRQIQTIIVTVIKLGKIDEVNTQTSVPNFIEIAPGVPPLQLREI